MTDRLNQVLRPFWNADQNRLRAPLRIVFGTLVAFVLILLMASIPPIKNLPEGEALFMGIDALLVFTIAVPGYIGALIAGAYVLDRRPITNYGLQLDREWLREAAVGAAVGGAMITGAVAFLLPFGWAEVNSVLYNTTAYPFIVPAALFLLITVVNLTLQIAFNVFLVKNTAEGLSGRVSPKAAVAAGIVVAMLIRVFLYTDVASAGMYGALVELVLHLTSMLAYVYTGNAGMPAGFAIGWTSVSMFVFGVPTSSGSAPISLMSTELVGPAGITGGEFGIDGGLAGLFVAVLGLFFIFGWIRWQHDLHLPDRVHQRVDRRDN